MALETVIFIVIALLVGSGYPIQAGINATLAQFQSHPLMAAFTNTTVASLVLIVVMVVFRVPLPSLGTLAGAPWWAWTGGCLGAVFVLSALVIAPKLGAAAFISTTIVGTMTASMIIDHFGLLAYKVQPVTTQRLLGAALVIAGMMLIQWRR